MNYTNLYGSCRWEKDLQKTCLCGNSVELGQLEDLEAETFRRYDRRTTYEIRVLTGRAGVPR